MTPMANFDVGALRLLMTSDGAVFLFDQHTSKPLEFHFGAYRKRLGDRQCEKLCIRCEARGILAKFFAPEIGLGKEWNDFADARVGGATFGADGVPDAIQIPCATQEFPAIVREYMTPDGNPTRMEEFVGWLREQSDVRGREYCAKAVPHGGAPHVSRLMRMVAQVEANLDGSGLSEADLDDEAPQSPFDLLDFVLEGDLTGVAAKLEGNSRLLNQAMWFGQPVPDILDDGPALLIVTAFFRSNGVLRHCVGSEVDAAIVDSNGRSVAHFVAAAGSLDIVGALRRAFPDLSFDALDGAGRSPAGYAARLDCRIRSAGGVWCNVRLWP
jgi:hypothetical protein